MNKEDKIIIENRFNSLMDIGSVLESITEGVINAPLYLVDLLNLSSFQEADALMLSLENKDTELQNSPEKKYADYLRKRNKEYLEAGADISTVVEAIWESFVEGDSTKLDLLQTKRLEVKAKIPKVEKPIKKIEVES